MADFSIFVWIEGKTFWSGKWVKAPDTTRKLWELRNSGFCRDLLGQKKHLVCLNSGMRSIIVEHGEPAVTVFFEYFSPFGIEPVLRYAL